MNHYIDICIKPDVEMRENVLLNKVYTKLHKALHSLQATDIGVSFPEYDIKLGCLLRIHAKEERLTDLQNSNWLGGLIGYCDISPIQPIPDTSAFRTISRIQTTMSPAKLKRLLNRGTISIENVKKYKAKMFQKGLNSPYLELESASSGHKYRRYIAFGELVDQPSDGTFDHFGLSKTATIPWF